MIKIVLTLTALASLTIASQAQLSWEENIRRNQQAAASESARQAEKWCQTMEQDRQIMAQREAEMKAATAERQREQAEADQALATMRSNDERREEEKRLAEIARDAEQEKQEAAYEEQVRRGQEAIAQKRAAAQRELQLENAARESQRLQEQRAEAEREAVALREIAAGNFQPKPNESAYEFGYRLGLAICDNLGGRKRIAPEELGALAARYQHPESDTVWNSDYGAGLGQALSDEGVFPD